MNYFKNVLQSALLGLFSLPNTIFAEQPAVVMPISPVALVPASLPVATQASAPAATAPALFQAPATAGPIRIFSTLPSTGGTALLGMDLLSGITLVVNKTNAESILGKSTIELLDTDNQNDPALAVSQINKFLPKTNLGLCIFATDAVTDIAQMSISQNVGVLFPITGDARLRTKTLTNCFHLRASLEAEISALVNYCVNVAMRTKIAILYEDSSWGEQALAFAKQSLSKLSIVPKGTACYPVNTVEVLNAITEISKVSPNAVLCLSNARPTYNFITQGLKRGLKNCKFLGLGEMVPNQDVLSKSRGIDLVTSSVVPSPFKSQTQIAQEYRKDMAKYFANRSLSQFSFEGYIATRLFVEVSKNILSNPLGVVNLPTIKALLEGLSNYNFEGLTLTFNPETRSLQNKVWINTGMTEDWIMV